jgi:hypothetical protein
LLVQRSTEQAQQQAENPAHWSVLIPYDQIEKDSQALVDDSDESETRGTDFITAPPAAVPDPSSCDAAKQQESDCGVG